MPNEGGFHEKFLPRVFQQNNENMSSSMHNGINMNIISQLNLLDKTSS